MIDLCLCGLTVVLATLGVVALIYFAHKKKPSQSKLSNFIQNSVFSRSSKASLKAGVVRESYQTVSTDGSDPIFDQFIIEDVIPQTEDQRKQWQFACLMLRNATETRNYSFTYKPNSGGRPLVNTNEPFSPPRKYLHNYIITRPNKELGQWRQKHAEKVIFDEFHNLWQSYCGKNGNQPPKSIVLYSWIMPCKNCTEAIIRNLSKLGVPVCIAYTIPYSRESNEQHNENKKRLSAHGIVIEKVEYPHRLEKR